MSAVPSGGGNGGSRWENLPPMPTGGGGGTQLSPIGVPSNYIAKTKRRIEKDALGRVIVDDNVKVKDGSRQVNRRDAKQTATDYSGLVPVGSKDALGRTVIGNDVVGPFDRSKNVYQKNAEPLGRQVTSSFEDVDSIEIPLYFEGAQFAPAAKPPEERAALQRKMVAAGILPKSFNRWGQWDEISIKSYEKALSYANQAGVDKNEIFARWETYGYSETVPGKVLTVKNPQDIAAVVRQASAKILGRSLSAGEIDQMVSSYQSIDRSAQEAMAAADVEAENGGDQSVAEAPTVESFATNSLRQENKGEADFMTGVGRMGEFYSILGEAGGGMQ